MPRDIARARARERRWHEEHREHRQTYARAYHVANAEKIRQRVREWRKTNKERRNETQRTHYEKNKEKMRAKRREYYASNPEKFHEYWRKWYAIPENREKDRIKGKKWKAANPDKTNVHWHKSRAKRLKAEGHHTPKDIARIRDAQHDRCAMPDCRKKLNGKGHVDHIVPLALGGTNWPRNLQLLCQPCNHRKNSKDPIKHIQSLGFLL